MGISFSKDGDDVVASVTPASVGAAPTLHDHDDRYYTEGEVDNLLGDKLDTSAAFDGAYSSLSDIPSTFSPSAHNHSASDINSGTLSVARGGTGAATLTSGSFLRGNGTGAVALRTPAQVKTDIDAMDKHFTVNAQTGASYTLALVDDGALVTCNNSGANTLTVPTNASVAIPVGSVINFAQIGAGVTTVVGASGVTINGVSEGSAAVNKRYSIGSLVQIATNEWLLSGPVADVE